jgi:putative resolvase
MYKISEFAAKVGVWVKTIQRWDNSGKLPARLDPLRAIGTIESI